MKDDIDSKSLSDAENFPERLANSIANRFNSVRSFSIESKIPASTLAQYLKGVSEPTRPVLCVIANILNLDIEWLITGKKSKISSDVLNAEKMQIAIETVEQALSFRNQVISAETKSKIVFDVYTYLIENVQNNPAKVIKIISDFLDIKTV